MSKEIIEKLIKEKPKHFSKMIQCDPILKEWVIKNSTIQTDRFVEKIYSALNPSITNICNNGNTFKFKGINIGYGFCGSPRDCKCSNENLSNVITAIKQNRSPEQISAENNKSKQTKLDRYGDENYVNVTKAKKTNLARFGVENPNQSDEVIQKRRNTNLDRYGHIHPMKNPEFREVANQTLRERYGVEHPLQHTEFLEKSQNTCMKNYGVASPCKNNEIKEKAKQTCLARYGAISPTKNSEIREKAVATSLEKYGVEYHKQLNYSPEVINLFSNDASELEKLLQKSSVKTIANEFGISLTTVYTYARQNNISIPVKNRSGFEEEIYDFVCSVYDGTVLDTVKTIIPPKHLDIVLPDINFAIECNGTYWHSELCNKNETYHANKTNNCIEKNMTLFHLWEHDWILKPDIVKSMILHRVGKSEKLFARQTILKKISTKLANEFFEKNHLQGKANAKLAYGLYRNNELVAAMSFGKPRFNKNYQWEIIRFATLVNHSISGGASKLFSGFVKENNPSSIISYAARGHATGNVYRILGMSHAGTTKPGYSYTKNFIDVFSRHKFQKHKLKNILENFDVGLTEKENMINHKYTRLWDSGNDIYVWNS